MTFIFLKIYNFNPNLSNHSNNCCICPLVGVRNDNSLQYSCLENPMDGGAWQATVHGVPKCQTQLKQFNTHIYKSTCINKLTGVYLNVSIIRFIFSLKHAYINPMYLLQFNKMQQQPSTCQCLASMASSLNFCLIHFSSQNQRNKACISLVLLSDNYYLCSALLQ